MCSHKHVKINDLHGVKNEILLLTITHYKFCSDFTGQHVILNTVIFLSSFPPPPTKVSLNVLYIMQ